MNDELNKIPLVDIKKYIDIRNRKTVCVQSKMYEEADRLRDEEKTLETKYPILPKIKANDVISYLIKLTRDRKIDDILDD